MNCKSLEKEIGNIQKITNTTSPILIIQSKQNEIPHKGWFQKIHNEKGDEWLEIKVGTYGIRNFMVKDILSVGYSTEASLLDKYDDFRVCLEKMGEIFGKPKK
jgi:hypothetical protein